MSTADQEKASKGNAIFEKEFELMQQDLQNRQSTLSQNSQDGKIFNRHTNKLVKKKYFESDYKTLAKTKGLIDKKLENGNKQKYYIETYEMKELLENKNIGFSYLTTLVSSAKLGGNFDYLRGFNHCSKYMHIILALNYDSIKRLLDSIQIYKKNQNPDYLFHEENANVAITAKYNGKSITLECLSAKKLQVLYKEEHEEKLITAEESAEELLTSGQQIVFDESSIFKDFSEEKPITSDESADPQVTSGQQIVFDESSIFKDFSEEDSDSLALFNFF